ncbi:hypothetical protein K1719_021446 [Acacia pycnantha]|nr:hypothetical protein K1719_021446 [Acacia pycnantha]
MGCTQSKIENEEAVARCKERKQYMKEAVTGTARHMDDEKDDFDYDENETHATILNKLLAWEKKLYDEVKQNGAVRLPHPVFSCHVSDFTVCHCKLPFFALSLPKFHNPSLSLHDW